MKTFALTSLLLAGFFASALAVELTDRDKKFINDTAIAGMTEVRLGAVAKDRATKSGVKDFGAMMAEDHTKANAKLKELATAKGIALPGELDSKHQNVADKLGKLAGAEFDKAYVEEMISGHKKVIDAFEDAAKNADDADLKAFANDTLPVLRGHLNTVQSLEEQVK